MPDDVLGDYRIWIAAAGAIIGMHAFMAGQRLARILIRWADRKWPPRGGKGG